MSSSCVQESLRGGLWSPLSTRKEMEGRVWPDGSQGQGRPPGGTRRVPRPRPAWEPGRRVCV